MSSENRNRILSLSERLYKALLIAYPEDFRNAYGAKMVQAFGDLCRQKLARDGLAGLFVVWIRAILDLGLNASAERFKTILTSNPPERKPWLAALLSFLFVGLGQLYNRQFRKAVPLLFVGVVDSIFLRHGSDYAPAFWGVMIVVFMVVGVLAMVDAWRSAEKINAARIVRVTD